MNAIKIERTITRILFRVIEKSHLCNILSYIYIYIYTSWLKKKRLYNKKLFFKSNDGPMNRAAFATG